MENTGHLRDGLLCPGPALENLPMTHSSSQHFSQKVLQQVQYDIRSILFTTQHLNIQISSEENVTQLLKGLNTNSILKSYF